MFRRESESLLPQPGPPAKSKRRGREWQEHELKLPVPYRTAGRVYPD